ncbi:MAG: type II toxin-antitoxin system Phd/YefM family antitoxin [Planctomycetes bacterium]|nr:type II toxin-antitoxin system Phd/YefM family antitoxin [Planctomycetota bacterium]
MKTVSVDELKRNLSAVLAEAARGERIIITRHKRPIAALSPAHGEHEHQGVRFGQGSLAPLFRRATKGKYLEVLEQDRRGREGE